MDRIQAFDERFWSLVQNAYKKLRMYDYSTVIDTFGGMA